MGVAAKGVDGAHAQDRAGRHQQRQEQRDRSRIAVFAEDAQTLHALLLLPPQQLESQIALGRHINWIGLKGLDLVEWIPEQFQGQFTGQNIGIQRQLVASLWKRVWEGLDLVRHRRGKRSGDSRSQAAGQWSEPAPPAPPPRPKEGGRSCTSMHCNHKPGGHGSRLNHPTTRLPRRTESI
jgi:hypothetical protein